MEKLIIDSLGINGLGKLLNKHDEERYLGQIVSQMYALQ